MDEHPNKASLEAKDFKPGDLVAIAANHILIEEFGFGLKDNNYTYGVVLENTRPQKPLFPQVAVYVFKEATIEWHWPSYLEIVSSRR